MVSKNQIKFITSLQQKKYRNQHGMFVVEGNKVIFEFLQCGYKPQFIYTLQPEKFIAFREIVFKIEFQELKKISSLTNPSDSLAVFQIPDTKPLKEQGLLVATDALRDPGNLGTIIRLCDWFGVTDLICSDDTVDVYNPKVVQATMGSLARVQLHYFDLSDFLKKTSLPVFGAFMEGTNVYQVSLPQEGILVMGNESHGISKEIERLITQKISIPRFGELQQTESLNVATATAILLNEFRRNFSGT